MNMFVALGVTNIPASSTQVMLFDMHPDGPYMDLIQQAFSPNYPVIRHKHYKGKKVYMYTYRYALIYVFAYACIYYFFVYSYLGVVQEAYFPS